MTPAPDARFILVYTNDDGTTTSHRHWTLAEAKWRVARLNRAELESASGGRWTIHETNEVPT